MNSPFRQYRPIERNEHFIVAGDCSEGLNDDSTCQFFSKTCQDVPLVYQAPVLGSEMTTAIFPVLNKIFDITHIKPVVAFERAAGGFECMERLANINYDAKYDIYKMQEMGVDEPEPTIRLGFSTNSATRPLILSTLKNFVDNQTIKIYDKQTIEQLFSFVKVRGTTSVKAQAEYGMHDDLVIPLAIACYLHLKIETILSGVPHPSQVSNSRMTRPSGDLKFFRR